VAKSAKVPVWVLDAVVLAIHERQLAEHGGAAGTRDIGLLESALARPKQLHAYGGARASLSRLAAAYASGIVRNHPFVDGNKRTAFVTCLLFLHLNGVARDVSQQEKYRSFMALAAGDLDETAFAGWIEQHSVVISRRKPAKPRARRQ
jgi:death-on-curing protein